MLVESCESTNRLARERGEAGAPHGEWVSARVQTGGRGRWGRSWESLSGNLFLSVILRPEPRCSLTWIPMLSALTVLEVLKERLPGLPIRIKWPNDLWLEGAKLAGLLCETVASKDQPTFVVLGLGLNVAQAPGGLDQRTTALSGVIPGLADPAQAEGLLQELRPGLALRIADAVRRLESEGASFIPEIFWRHAQFCRGDSIEWGEPASGSSRTGTILGLGQLGELRVESEGRELPLYAEEIRGLRSAGG